MRWRRRRKGLGSVRRPLARSFLGRGGLAKASAYPKHRGALGRFIRQEIHLPQRWFRSGGLDYRGWQFRSCLPPPAPSPPNSKVEYCQDLLQALYSAPSRGCCSSPLWLFGLPSWDYFTSLPLKSGTPLPLFWDNVAHRLPKSNPLDTLLQFSSTCKMSLSLFLQYCHFHFLKKKSIHSHLHWRKTPGLHHG